MCSAWCSQWPTPSGEQDRELAQLTYKHGLYYGLAQALALFPGVSRSGGTISAGLFMGYTREAAARYSFLLAIPAVFGSGLYQLYKVVSKEGITGPYGLPETALATVIAFFVGYVIIGWFLKYVSTRGYRLFVWYRILLGLCPVPAARFQCHQCLALGLGCEILDLPPCSPAPGQHACPPPLRHRQGRNRHPGGHG